MNIEDAVRTAQQQERAAIVKWLNRQNRFRHSGLLADEIERGDHLGEQSGG